MTIFKVWGEDQDKSAARRFEVWDHAEAAQEWARCDDRDSADYCIVNGSPATVFVQADYEVSPKRYIVFGEAVPSYSARPVENN